MNLDVIIPLAFLSYYRYSFFLIDFLIFVWICFAYYQLAYKLFPPLIPEKKRTKFEWVRNAIGILMALQMLCYFILLLTIFLKPPILVHIKTEIGFPGYVFVLFVILRLINIIMVASFLASCWFMMENKSDDPKRWFLLVVVLLVYYLFMMFYTVFPTLNKALSIYEMFFNIRNLYIVNDPKKKFKTFGYLQQMGCIPDNYYTLYEDEWNRTFKNGVFPIAQCS
jgi:hypothetical protein